MRTLWHSLLAGVLMLLPLAGWAGRIQIMPDARVEWTNGMPLIAVECFNKGDEPVQVLSVEAGLVGKAVQNVVRTPPRTVAPGDFFREQIPIQTLPAKPGVYQAVVRLRYADFTGAGFSSVLVTEVERTGPESVLPWVSVTVDPVSLGWSGPVRVTALLLQDEPAEVTIRLVLPDEFECSSPEQRVMLEPDTPRVVTFEISSRLALPGGVYPIYALAGHDSTEVFRSTSAAGTVTVTELKWAGQSPWVWLLGALMLCGIVEWGKRGRGKWGNSGMGCTRKRRGADVTSDAIPPFRYSTNVLEWAVLASVCGFILWNLSPTDLVRNTTTVGGDTPAHLYLVSHLRDQLFHHGRIISWADGWWCGFPMFQYYFVLPYFTAALLSMLIPLNVAFKLVSVAGLVMTPWCAYLAGRLWRLPRPAPVILAIMMVPFLFVNSHTMWGVNTASTLAGMIANSWSFALLLPALASACRDMEEGRFRLRTVFLMVLVLASHFFTSVMMFLSLAIVPILVGKEGKKNSPRRHGGWERVRECIANFAAGEYPIRKIRDTTSVKREESEPGGCTLTRECLQEGVAGIQSGVPAALNSRNIFFPPLSLIPLRLRGKAFLVLVCESGLALLLMAWWIVPLVAKSAYAMDFGTNWTVTLWKTFPPYVAGVLVFAGVAVVGGMVAWGNRGIGEWGNRGTTNPLVPIAVLIWMLLISVLLFKYGFALSPVFVNVRLWPFIFFAILALGAVGMGGLWKTGEGEKGKRGMGEWGSRFRGESGMRAESEFTLMRLFYYSPILLFTLAVLLVVRVGDSLTGTLTGPGLTRSWAAWNYAGLEAKPAAPVFEKLVMPLKGTPGRLANDLCEENNQLGSSRIFELAPCLAGKPVLEGGLVNSALGSMYSYTIQGETSRSCAGFPPIVTPQPFNFTHATRHLALFNVKHFIARSEQTKNALRQSPDWRFMGRELDWEAYELMTHDGRLVSVLPRMPVMVRTARWKECSLEWLVTPGAEGQFAIWEEVAAHSPGSAVEKLLLHLTEKQFLDLLAALRKEPQMGVSQMSSTACVTGEEVTDGGIRFRTTAMGQPHLVKMTWFPNWKVKGAARVYCVSPGFMLVFPEQETVELYYGITGSDSVGYLLTVLGCLTVGVVLWRGACCRCRPERAGEIMS